MTSVVGLHDRVHRAGRGRRRAGRSRARATAGARRARPRSRPDRRWRRRRGSCRSAGRRGTGSRRRRSSPCRRRDSQPPAAPRPRADVAVGACTARRAHEDLADLAGRQRRCRRRDDLHLDRDRPADRAAVRQPLGAGDDRRRPAPRCRRTAPRSSAPSQSIHASFSHGGHGAPRCHTPAATTRRSGAHRVGQSPDARHHRRHDEHTVAPVPVDELQRALRVERRRAPRGCRGQSAHRPHERAVVVHRAGHHHRLVGADHHCGRTAGSSPPGRRRRSASVSRWSRPRSAPSTRCVASGTAARR